MIGVLGPDGKASRCRWSRGHGKDRGIEKRRNAIELMGQLMGQLMEPRAAGMSASSRGVIAIE
jgi:hypothetical protein